MPLCICYAYAMNIGQSIVLGIIQGVTEFLPISSTAHLILARNFLGIGLDNSLVFDLFLNLATVIAVFIYFRKDFGLLITSFFRLLLRRTTTPPERTFLFSVIVGAIPALLLGFIFQHYVEYTLRSPFVIVIFLLLGSALFWFAEKRATQKKSVTVSGSFVIGFFQALALFPGVSRSGATISGGLFLGLSREEATRLSFMLGFPVLAVASIYKVLTFGEVVFAAPMLIPSIVGFIAALVSGLYAIGFLMKFLKTNSLSAFIPYRVALALLVLFGLF